MDRGLFSERMVGNLVSIDRPRRDWAFIPNPMPPAWKIPLGLWPLISQAKLRLGTLAGKCSQLSNPELL